MEGPRPKPKLEKEHGGFLKLGVPLGRPLKTDYGISRSILGCPSCHMGRNMIAYYKALFQQQLLRDHRV